MDARAVRQWLLAAVALALAACGRDEAPMESEGSLSVLSSPRVTGRLYTCDLTFLATRGPITSRSRALVRMGVDTGAATQGWKVESVTVVEPLPGANGFDPWLPFAPGLDRRIVKQDGATLTLAESEGKPVTLDTATGDLHWRVEGLLGETAYSGGCV
jgi:hypothetical protein